MTPTPQPSSSSSGGSNGGVYTVHVTANGSDAVDGSFTETLQLSSQATSQRCPVPSDLSGSIAGTRVELQMSQSSTGSGQPQQLSPGDIQFIVAADTWGVASAANAPHPSGGMLQRNGDGSGSLSFQNLALESNPSHQPQESGSIIWTCA